MIILRFVVLVFLVASSWSAAFNTLSSQLNALGKFLSFSVVFFVPALYMQPTFEAWLNKHANLTSVALLNIFLGWTVLGWVGAMVWAFSKPSSVVVVPVHGANYDPSSPTKVCPYCAEKILASAIKCKHCGSMLNE